MKILLVGPYPPPHGGISVHVRGALERLTEAGVPCQVLNTERRTAKSSLYARARQWAGLVSRVRRHKRLGWTLHLHTNGHNWKSWAVAAICGMAGRSPAGCLLTVHSGMAPGYLRSAPGWQKALARFSCSRFTRVICVSPEIRAAVLDLGVPSDRIDLLPAFLGQRKPAVPVAGHLRAWLARHRPVLSTALFFRPEYGFELLLACLVRLRLRYPDLGCVVMGSAEQGAPAARRIQEQNLEQHVLLAGDINHDTCLSVMAASDVFVRPTLKDGDSVSVREALSLGVPVVASATGMRPAGVTLFQTGSVDDMLSKIELAIAAPRSSPRASVDTVDRLVEIYRKIAAPRNSYVAA
jgi:glycogen(starch) synthase